MRTEPPSTTVPFVLDHDRMTLEVEYPPPAGGVPCRPPSSACRERARRHRLSAAVFCLLNSGFWLLDSGFWILDSALYTLVRVIFTTMPESVGSGHRMNSVVTPSGSLTSLQTG
jgi:hypothetical protein